MLTRRMAFLGSMKSIYSAASSGGLSQMSQKSHRKSQLSLYDKISRNMSFFDTTSLHSFSGFGGVRMRNNRQRSVSDVVKPQLEDLSVGPAGVINESFESDLDAGDPNSIAYLIEKRRLSTIDEDSPNPTLNSNKNVEAGNHIKIFFDSIEEEKIKQTEVTSPGDDLSLDLSDPVYV